MISRCDSAATVSKTSELLPEPETPVKTVRRRFGISMLTSLRLFSRAPCTRIRSWRSAACGTDVRSSDPGALLIVSPAVARGRKGGPSRPVLGSGPRVPYANPVLGSGPRRAAMPMAVTLMAARRRRFSIPDLFRSLPVPSVPSDPFRSLPVSSGEHDGRRGREREGAGPGGSGSRQALQGRPGRGPVPGHVPFGGADRRAGAALPMRTQRVYAVSSKRRRADRSHGRASTVRSWAR